MMKRRASDHGFHRWRWRMLLAWIVLFTATTMYLVNGLDGQQARTRHLARSTNASLCTFRHDLEARIASAYEFLSHQPNGAFGFTRAQLLTNIHGQQRTVEALANLHCKGAKR